MSKKHKRKDINPLPWVALVVALLIGTLWLVSRMSKSSPQRSKPQADTVIALLPLPPPPPPKVIPPLPKNDPPPKEDEMLVQEPVPEDEVPADEPPPSPPDGLDMGPGSVGGTGPAIGSGGSGHGQRIGGTTRSAGRFGWYAAKVQSSIREALGRHPSTRSARLSMEVRIWADSSGRITRAQLVGTSGDANLDQSIRNQVLTGLLLPQAPPSDMPMPITLRITGRKPST